MAPLQFVRVIRNGELERFAFGEAPDTGEKHDERCVYPEECLVLSKLQENIADEEFGYRYKVLWDGIAAFLQPSDPSNADSIYVYLVQIDRGPLFAGVRYRSEGSSGLESGGLALQFYLPLDTPCKSFISRKSSEPYEFNLNCGKRLALDSDSLPSLTLRVEKASQAILCTIGTDRKMGLGINVVHLSGMLSPVGRTILNDAE